MENPSFCFFLFRILHPIHSCRRQRLVAAGEREIPCSVERMPFWKCLAHSFRSRKIIAILTFQVFPNSTPTCILPFIIDSRGLLNSMISSTELLCSEAFLAHALFYAISQNLSAEDLTGKVRFSFSQGPPLALPSIPMPGGIRDKQIIWREK